MDEFEQQQPESGDLLGNVAELRSEIARLEQLLQESNEAARNRIMQAHLSTAAIRAGMIDLDGLKLFDLSNARVNEHGEIEGIDAIVGEMKREKPWLFRGASFSSSANPPPAQSARAKHAAQMTPDEYRTARAELLRRR